MGVYFGKWGYIFFEWNWLVVKVVENGMWNVYFFVIVLISSISIIVGIIVGIDFVMKCFFFEEKKGVMLLCVVLVLLDKIFWLYKDVYIFD